ncbi:uncharacterized protein isoform X2 [Leptinotarsa decemlineata]|uniref:uncharacterized protein isoform X2 n=1 Tax=Leptinotarsa decemlineata TaxID=7539 RepID=UPI003D30D1F5
MAAPWRLSSQLPGTGSGFGSSPLPSSVGRIPAAYLKREISNRTMDPPPCVQNAMMTKDKKPFTYTPGGINLSDVRSPRMARRIEQNANLAGAGDIPKPRPPQTQNYDSLPPSTLAAMRPQPQVQVFPSGPPPPAPMRGGVPPPPPPPNNTVPLPPPPPTGPLPTQKIQAGDQVLERPDMTKIIPDNPMALLRKTGGPQPRNTFVDKMFAQGGKQAPGPRSPPTPPQKSPSVEPYNGNQPPLNGRGAPISPVLQQPQKHQLPYQPEQPVSHTHQREHHQYQPESPQYQPHLQHSQIKIQPAPQRSPPDVKNEPSKNYQPPVIERQQMKPRQNDVQPEIKTSTAHLGSLYIPPADQQQQRRIVSPSSPPVSQDSPNIQSPPLKESPKPWQTKKTQQEEIPPWAKKENELGSASFSPSVPKQQPQRQQPEPVHQIRPNQQQQWYQPEPVQQPRSNQQQQWQQPEPVQQSRPNQQPIGVRIEIRTNPASSFPSSEERKPNAVYVTQPLVFQDPGPGVPPQQKKIDSQGARIIPIRVEGTHQGSATPPTPSSERSFSRQQSFGNNPTQSNSFKIIQKITNTDEDEDDEDTPITKHSPRFPQNFQQPEQIGKMKVKDVDQNMSNTFKQVPRGSQQANNKGPQVRTIPIQIEGDYKPQEYVHPSEQTVPEPKKYTGSSIPSRSFKILQAMTAPENCANVDDRNEAYPYDEGSYYPQYPPPPFPPYWHNYYPEYPYPDVYSELSEGEAKTPSGSDQIQAPTPFWGYLHPPHYPVYKNNSVSEGSDTDTSSNPRTTPLPHLPFVHRQKPVEYIDEIKTGEGFRRLPQYPPYFDPYYFYYYYGYMPMYPPYPYYQISENDTEYCYAETEEGSELSNACVETNVTPNRSQKMYLDRNYSVDEQRPQLTDSESDSESCKLPIQKTNSNCLKSVKSVKDINVYNMQEDNSDDDVLDEVSSRDSGDDSDEESSSHVVDGNALQHELSVILEESECRTESRIRSVSVMSDSTTVADPSEDENEEDTPQVRVPLKFCITVGEEESKNVTYENGNLKTFNDTEIYASFTLKSPSVTPRKRSPCRDETEEDQATETSNHDEELFRKNEEETKETIEELDDGKESDESEDWWGILGKEDDQPISRKPQYVECDVGENELIPEQVEEKYVKNDYASAKITSEGKSSDTPITLAGDSRKTNSSNEVVDTIENSCNETNTVSIPNEVCEENNVLGKSESHQVTMTSSIYDDFEDIEVDTTGKLMEMENFVDQLEKIQNSFWNTRILKNSQEKVDHNKNNSAGFDENSVQEKKNESFKKSATTYYQNNVIETKGDKKQEKINPECGSTKECSTNYTGYNSSKSYRVFGNEKSTSETNNVTEKTYTEELCRQISNESDSDDTSDESEYSSEEDVNINIREPKNAISNEETEPKIPSIKERIQALKNSIKEKQQRIQEQKTEILIKEKECTYENITRSRTKSVSTKSSIKSFEELSEEEEIDSGVTSDMSRHISDTEEFSELKKLTRYQRAATHSRLFKLLQEGCDDEDSDGEKEETNASASIHQDIFSNEQRRRDHLRLPLSKNFDTDKNAEGSNNSPVNERLVGELIQSFLKHKKAQVFRNMPPEKLFAAATKILQEEFESRETSTSPSSFLSPMRSSTGYSTAVHTPQEFVSSHEDYKSYYESWNDNEVAYEENYEIIPSKAFRLLQEHSSYNKTGAISGLLARCPRVVSSKNVHNKLIKLLESSENSTTILDKPPPISNEVTNAS